MDSSGLEQQLLNHGPFSALFSGMVILGTFVNHNATSMFVHPSESWCQNTSIVADFKNVLTSMPSGLGAATIVIVIIFPLIPIFVNSQTKKWNEFKFDIIKCHVLGQGSVFGVSELLRHFVTVPEPSFLQKCNITVEECHNKAQQFQQLPFSTTTNTSYCRSENTPELFNSLHHFPDKTCCIIGASIVTFLATLYFWQRANTKGKSIYQAHSMQQCFIICAEMLCVTLILIYLFYLYYSFDGVQMYGILIGGMIQLMIICSTLPKKELNTIPI